MTEHVDLLKSMKKTEQKHLKRIVVNKCFYMIVVMLCINKNFIIYVICISKVLILELTSFLI